MTSRMEWAQCLPSPLLLLSMKLSVIKLVPARNTMEVSNCINCES